MKTISILETFDTETNERKQIKEYDYKIEAPNWLPNKNKLIYNSKGLINIIDLDTMEDKVLETGICNNCNNDHVLSPDGKNLAVSYMPEDGTSYIYMMPFGSPEVTQLTPLSPSFLHGWSIDDEITYCAFRGADKVDIYVKSIHGGDEKRLTDGVGYNDGPEYSPEGDEIWFNSTRGESGLMQVWKMDRNGTDLKQITDTDSNCWFPHISPDGKKIVYLEFRKDEVKPHEHLSRKHVSLWLMNRDGTDQKKLCDVFGGQGTINVNSWDSTSTKFAFVSYRVEEE